MTERDQPGEVCIYVSDFGDIPVSRDQLDRYEALGPVERRDTDRALMKFIGEHWAAGGDVKALALPL